MRNLLVCLMTCQTRRVELTVICTDQCIYQHIYGDGIVLSYQQEHSKSTSVVAMIRTIGGFRLSWRRPAVRPSGRAWFAFAGGLHVTMRRNVRFTRGPHG